MTDPRLARKIQETRTIAGQLGVDLAEPPLLATFEAPLWGTNLAGSEVSELARLPGTAVAVTSPDPLPEVRRTIEHAPHLHVVAERGLLVGLSGGATLHVYPPSDQELEAFAVALFAGVAPADTCIALGGHLSSGRQEVSFESCGGNQQLTPLELLHAVRRLGGTVAPASEEESAIVVDDTPAELAIMRAALGGTLAGQAVRVLRMPSGRFRFTPERTPRKLDPTGRARLHVLAQEIAMSSDRFLEARGEDTFGFVTEPVARWEYGIEEGSRRLAWELFGRPDTVLTHLGLHPVGGEGTLFFAYEGSETVWEAANKGISYVPVRDIAEYGRILYSIRKGES
jgi:hypothetical protein